SEIKKSLEELKKNPLKGKPLRNKLKNYRSLRVRNYRILYRIKNYEIRVYVIDKRELIYSAIFKYLMSLLK
ncbi:MAG: type II toxin-antitoxin system RelE/ParE family toxin, partial [Methanobrevibacter sp.]|nr:type II toxin-antitoxin system RelE/ParE family toxin [Methanobrevibacter sp.]